ncbi:MAG: DsrE family protein [Sulfuriferula sp.]
MKLGMVIYSTDSETAWNAFRLGMFALKEGDIVAAFLLAQGVECRNLDNEKFKVTEAMDQFMAAGGRIQACGTCLKLRNSTDTGVCEISTMQDLYRIARDSDKVLTF